jgi:hypothetical protein
VTLPPGDWDTGDVIRSRVFDLPGATLDDLLGALGVSRSPVAQQQAVLSQWMATPAAMPAPPKLLSAVRQFLAVSSA